jgi:hypothetical protein
MNSNMNMLRKGSTLVEVPKQWTLDWKNSEAMRSIFMKITMANTVSSASLTRQKLRVYLVRRYKSTIAT